MGDGHEGKQEVGEELNAIAPLSLLLFLEQVQVVTFVHFILEEHLLSDLTVSHVLWPSLAMVVFIDLLFGVSLPESAEEVLAWLGNLLAISLGVVHL